MNIEQVNLKLEEAYVMAKHSDAVRQGKRIRKLAKLWDCSTQEASKTIARVADVIAYGKAIERDEKEDTK
jgi:hypothetical protein